MGKQGPCYHCGVTSTPLWRNGPPEKPVLCNACGSRWRTKGTLANYTPLHARADLVDYEDQKPPRVKSISINKNKEVKLLKRKQNYDSMASGGVAYDYNHCFQKVVDEDMSNRSSSGSAISNSDAQFGSADASDLTGPAQSVVWDTMVPSRKRTCVNRPKQSSVEQLTKDLHAIMHEQQTSCFSGSSEEDLLLESATPMCSFEIGNGTVLFRDPSVITREEESEASSLSVDRQQYKTNEVYSCTPSLALHKGGKSISFLRPTSRTEKIRKSAEQVVGHEKLKRDNLQNEKLQILGNHNSPLRSINLQDVVNFEEFMIHLTDQEQQHLLKYLPSVDTTELPDSLENLFDSSEFKENLSAFQQLLADGVFDNSFSGAKAEDCKTLKGLALSNLMKSKWVECHRQLQESKTRSGGSANTGPQAMVPNKLAGGRRLRDVQNQNFPDARAMLMSPKRANMKGSSENKEYMENDGSCFSPRNLFALPHDGSTFLLESPFMDDNSEQDLLVDVPSSGFFPQAELLIPTRSFGSLQASTCSSSVSPHPLHPR